MSNIVLFGAGESASYALNHIRQTSWVFSEDTYKFADNNKDLWGTEFGGIEIVSPNEIDTSPIEWFVITSVYRKQIRTQLLEELNVPAEKILLFDEYACRRHVEWTYKQKYAGKRKKNNDFKTEKIVVYTSITGTYDDLKEPQFLDDNITYVCFTNNKEIKSKAWNVEYVQSDVLDNMHLAKHFKLEPHKYFPEYETSVWLDGKFLIQDDLREYIKLYGGEEPILCFPHPIRSCIYSEAGSCLHYGKGSKEDLIKQISYYYSKGYPLDSGLYEMGGIVRRHNDEKVKKIMADWKEQINMFSYRDQISFPFVCWKNDFAPDICDLHIEDNRFLKMYMHNG